MLFSRGGDDGAHRGLCWAVRRRSVDAAILLCEAPPFTFVLAQCLRQMQTDSVRKQKSVGGWLRDQPASSTRTLGCASPLIGSIWPKTLSNEGGHQEPVGAPEDRMTDRIRIFKHEAIPGCGSFEVRFPDGRESLFFCRDNIPARRLRRDMMDRATALETAKAVARAARDRLE